MGVWKIDETEANRSNRREAERLAINLLLQNMLGNNPVLGHKENGMPFLEDNHLNISISHTKGYVAVILSRFTYPGIDIEYPSDRAWRLRHKFLSDNELYMFARAREEEIKATICWCAKETAYKTLRESGVDFIKHLHILPFKTDSKNGSLLLEETKTISNQVFAINYQITDDYILTWKE